MGLKKELKESKELKADKVIFEALLIYIACWCKDEWKLSDFYGEKGFVSGKQSSLLSNTKKRIERLTGSGIPIEIGRINKTAPGKGSNVKFDRKKVIQEFISDIGLEGEESLLFVQKFKEIIAKAIPLLHIHITCYHQSKTFANDNLKSVFKTFILIWQEYPKCVKYFPIWLSFNPAIHSTNAIANGSSQKWSQAFSRSYTIELPTIIHGYFFQQVTGIYEILEEILPDPSIMVSPTRRSVLDLNIHDLRAPAIHSKSDIHKSCFDRKSESIYYLSRITKEVFEEKIPGKYEFYYKNRDEFFLRFVIINKLLFALMTTILQVEKIDYSGELKIDGTITIPGFCEEGRLKITIPLKGILRILEKTKD